MSQTRIHAHDMLVRPARQSDTDAVMAWLPRVLGDLPSKRHALVWRLAALRSRYAARIPETSANPSDDG